MEYYELLLEKLPRDLEHLRACYKTTMNHFEQMPKPKANSRDNRKSKVAVPKAQPQDEETLPSRASC